MSTTSRLRAALERMDRAVMHLPSCIEHVEDEAEDLSAQHFDPSSRSNVSSVLVCKEHGVDLADCRKDELTCTIAIPVAVHNDPTGEAAVATSHARNTLAELDRKVRAAENLSHWLDDFVHDHSPRRPRQANTVEARKAAQENAKPPGCVLCAKQDKWSAPHTKEPTDVGGVLDEALLICSPHYDFVRSRRRLPTSEEDRYYARKDKWPKVKQVDRLVAGVGAGRLD